MGIINTVTTILIALPQAAPATNSVSAALMDIEGQVLVKKAGSNLAAKVGARLKAGQTLLITEDSSALLLYVNGKYSRIQGPARIKIKLDSTAASDGALSAQLTKRLADVFGSSSRRRITSTVGGVRGDELLVLSPYKQGVMPRKFRIVIQPPNRNSRQLGSLALADEIRILGHDGKKQLFELPLDSARLAQWSKTVDLGPESAGRFYSLELRFVEVDEEGEVVDVIDTSRYRFRIASREVEESLAKALEEIKHSRSKGKPDSPARVLARIDAFLKYDFQGEALAELVEMQRSHPENPIWGEILSDFLNAHRESTKSLSSL